MSTTLFSFFNSFPIPDYANFVCAQGVPQGTPPLPLLFILVFSRSCKTRARGTRVCERIYITVTGPVPSICVFSWPSFTFCFSLVPCSYVRAPSDRRFTQLEVTTPPTTAFLCPLVCGTVRETTFAASLLPLLLFRPSRSFLFPFSSSFVPYRTSFLFLYSSKRTHYCGEKVVDTIRLGWYKVSLPTVTNCPRRYKYGASFSG